MADAFVKSPSAVLDYLIDWTPDLATGETVTAHTITADTGITVTSHTATTTAVTVWLSGGTDGVTYKVTCHVTTSAGRQDDRTITILCRQR